MSTPQEGAEARGREPVDCVGEVTEQGRAVQWLKLRAHLTRRLRSYVRHVSREDDDVAELIAETWSRAWTCKADFLIAPDPATSLICIAREVCRDWMRARRHEVTLCETDGDGDVEPEASTCGSMSIEEAQGQQRWADRVLSQLTQQQRLAVDYRYRWSWSYEVIAAAMDTSEATARVHAWRGLRRLRAVVASDPLPALRDMPRKRTSTTALRQ